MRELIAAAAKKKPLIALIDPDASRGGLSLDQIREELREAEGSYARWGLDTAATPGGDALYAQLAHAPIEW